LCWNDYYCNGKLLAAARLHLIETESTKTALRLVDFASIIPSLTGKIELVYEGEQEGADYAAQWALTIKNKLNKAENNTSLKVDSIGLNQFLYGDN